MNSISSLVVRLILLTVNLSLWGWVTAFSQTTYTVTDLGTLGGLQSNAYGINTAGQVVGYSFLPDNTTSHAFLWQNEVMTDLRTLGGTSSVATGINTAGKVVGYSATPAVSSHAFLWDSVMTDLGTLGGILSLSHAYGINTAGQVVGSSNIQDGENTTHAFLWENGVMSDLGTIGGIHSFANGINDSSQVVGSATTSGNETHAIRWQNGFMTDLNSLIDSSSGWTLITAVTINDNGEIVGLGVHNGQTRAFLLTPFTITSPVAGEVWIAGEQDTIRWEGASSIDFVTISLSVDFENGGGNFANIVQSHPADEGYYVWDIPDTILSRKCAISIEDASDPSIDAVGEVFKIKGYELTRIGPDSNYERFRADDHGWGFANREENMWPLLWWEQFDYQNGLDPNTGQGYPNSFALGASSKDFIDWPLFVDLFGLSQCYLNPSLGIYSPIAVLKWFVTKDDFEGSCAGFAVTSFLAFGWQEALLDTFPSIGEFERLYDLIVNDARRKVINQMWGSWQGREHLSYAAAQDDKTPRETLQDIKDMFLSETRSDGYLYISPDTVSEAHAVNPYKLQRLFGQRFFLYVYDNNFPGDTTRVITIDSSQNTWSYGGWGGSDGFYLMDPVVTYLQHPTLLGAPLKQRDIPVAAGSQYVEVYNTPDAEIVLTDQDGNTIGFDGTAVFNNTNGIPMIPITSVFDPPIGYYVPNQAYAVAMSGFTDSLTHFTLFADSIAFNYTRSDADLLETDELCYDGGLAMHNPDMVTKTVNVRSIQAEANSEKVFDILQCTFANNDSMHFAVVNTDHFQMVNAGIQKTYDLDLELATAVANPRFEHPSITLAAGSSHEIVPDWTDLSQPVTIYVDLGNNGTIDDTLLVANTVDVREQGGYGIPKEYSLAQNYPNPFNPITAISYQLPTVSYVTLRVYNLLGQEVATLVDELQDAGYKMVEFDASNLSSGVYFYRIEARATDAPMSFTKVKKMVVIK